MFEMYLGQSDGPIFCSWSGGKDSALAFYHAKVRFGHVDFILTMFDESCEVTRAHGLSREHIEMQAKSMNVKLISGCASWEDYERVFSELLRSHFKNGLGVFGDIDLQEHLDWVARVCFEASVSVFEPLWKRSREELIDELLTLGFKAKVVAVREGCEKLLGMELGREFFHTVRGLGIDLSGENGEYHTFVYDGPTFAFPVPVDNLPMRVIRSGADG